MNVADLAFIKQVLPSSMEEEKYLIKTNTWTCTITEEQTELVAVDTVGTSAAGYIG